MVSKALAALGILGTLATVSFAGEVRLRTNGVESSAITVNDTPPFSDLEIDLGSEIDGPVDVHIYDDDGVDTSLGAITIRGRFDGASYPIRVVIVGKLLTDPNVGPGFSTAFENPADALDEIGPGLAQLGGLQFVDSENDALNTSLRDNATVSVNVGNLTGDVTAGRIFRIAALDDGSGTLGTISGNITSTQTDPATIEGPGEPWEYISTIRPAIAYVEATHSISGDVVAMPVLSASTAIFAWNPNDILHTRPTWSSIGEVIVSGSASTDLLTGDVKADYGHVERVVAGAIGTDTDTVAIRGGVRIGQIVTTSTAPAYLDIDAGARGKDDLLVANALKDLQFFNTERPTSIQVVDIKGDLIGDIELFDVFGDRALSSSSEEYYQSNHQGIFIGGDFVGDIIVDYDYENADMIARSFQGDIKIGQMLQGAVVAVGTDGSTDPSDGTIGSIEVGLPLHPYADGPNPNEEGGFQGTFKTTLDAPMNGPGFREIWYGPALTFDTERAKDSVIRAYTSIGSVRITKMSNGLVRTSGNPGLLRPRVEAPYVGSILIDEMESGSVWSGTLIEYPASAFDNITDNYASVGVLSIGCVGPAADLWLQGTPLIEVTSALAGEIHVPSLANGQTIRIGEQFLNVAGIESPLDPNSPPCGKFLGGWHAGQVFGYDQNALSYIGEGIHSNEEPTPRSVWDGSFTDPFGRTFGYPLEPTPEQPNPPFAIETNTLPFDGANRGVAAYGRILIREPDGLKGQIIIDANNTGPQRAATHWLGDVEIGTGESPDTGDPNISVTPEVISTDEERFTAIGAGSGEGPLYTALPSDFGGGAVGLVPFTVHDRASDPVNPEPGQEPLPALVDVYFNHTGTPYPGTANDPGLRNSIKIEFYGPLQLPLSSTPLLIEYNPRDGAPIDMTPSFTVTALSARRLELTRSDTSGTDDLSIGLYTVKSANLYCGGLISPVPVADFVYTFRIGADCNFNGIRDAKEIQDDPNLDLYPDNGPGNTPGNGVLDECDNMSGCPACAADYNQDGGVAGDDLSAFFFDYEQGLLDCADINQDGGISGDDLASFFTVFEAGGC